MCLICQRYKFKSKSQLPVGSLQDVRECVWYVKDTNLKANHNGIDEAKVNYLSVFDMSKIQI